MYDVPKPGRSRGSNRLNDTVAIAGRPFAAGEEHTIRSRKIDNGYITHVSTCNPETGEYKCAEVFTKEPPRITPPSMDGRQSRGTNVGSEVLADTKKYLGDKV